MSISAPQVTINQNYLQPTKYQLSFAKIPNTVFFCQTVNIPGVSIDVIKRPTPVLDFKLAGDKITFSDFEIDFIVDVDMNGWLEVFTWMLSIGFAATDEKILSPAQIKQMFGSPKNTSDATLTFNDNQNNPNVRFHLKECFPINLTGIKMDSKATADQTLTSQVTLAVNYYTIEKFSS